MLNDTIFLCRREEKAADRVSSVLALLVADALLFQLALVGFGMGGISVVVAGRRDERLAFNLWSTWLVERAVNCAICHSNM